MPRLTKWTVAIDWDDLGVIDTDEVVVFAESEECAKFAAKKKWRLTIGAKWPHCRVTRVWILTPSEHQPRAFRLVDFR